MIGRVSVRSVEFFRSLGFTPTLKQLSLFIFSLLAFGWLLTANPSRQQAVPLRWQASDSHNDFFWIKGRATVTHWPKSEPLALTLSGLFSAEIYWNGQRLGYKGSPGSSAAAETPGPIDGNFLVPEQLVRPGDNQILIRASSHHQGYSAARIVQTVELSPYQGSTRPLAYYLPALIIAGALIALLGWFIFRMDISRRTDRCLAGAALALLIALIFEVSRAFWNYPYNLHVYRQGATWLFLSIHVWLLTTSTNLASPTSKGAALRSGLPLFLGGAIAWILVSGMDQRISATLFAGFATASISLARELRKDVTAIPLAAIMFSNATFLIVDPKVFLDSGVYGFGLLAIASAAVRTASPLRSGRNLDPLVSRTSFDPQLLIVSNAGFERAVPWSNVCSLRALGNYTEVELRTGSRWLDNRSLGRLLRDAPSHIWRIHKSYAVNILEVKGLSTRRPGSYAVVLQGGGWLPLSRSRRPSVRNHLRSQSTPTGF